jgi:cell wall-associated NlpC family hydrolase
VAFQASPAAGFDCSGLTMWAWAQAGVSLPHYSRAQYAAFPHVPLDQLQPGDLVFMGSPIHHVGMYIGGGQMVHASMPGVGVVISPIHNLVGAARP